MATIWTRRQTLAGGGALLAASMAPGVTAAQAEPIDAIVGPFLERFAIPGLAISLVRPGAPPLTRGYGVRRLGDAARVDGNTLFAIASNTKAFVAASIALLVEESKLAWDAPVIDYMPDFALSDPVATRLTTVRDLLCHRSGLALGAGDLMQFPQGDFSRSDMLRGLRYLPLARGFRSGYAYDNILYVVAGLLVERVAGIAWEQFVTTRLLQPLGMNDAAAIRTAVHTSNLAGRHARLGPPARGIGKVERIEPNEALAGSPAGGINASVNDLARWHATQLAQGVTPDGKRLWSAASADEMWRPQIITAATHGPAADAPTRSVIAGYALGWFVSDYRGRRLLAHSGAVGGQVTQTALLPEQGMAVAVLTNSEEVASGALRNALLDHLLGAPRFDWLTAAAKVREKDETDVRAAVGDGDFKAPPGGPSLPLAAYAGRYRDPWYGDIVIAQKGDALTIDFTRTPVFKGVLEPFGPDSFRTRFARGAGEDAVVGFAVENGRPTRLKLRQLSPIADFSYDFHDLAPVRI